MLLALIFSPKASGSGHGCPTFGQPGATTMQVNPSAQACHTHSMGSPASPYHISNFFPLHNWAHHTGSFPHTAYAAWLLPLLCKEHGHLGAPAMHTAGLYYLPPFPCTHEQGQEVGAGGGTGSLGTPADTEAGAMGRVAAGQEPAGCMNL